jgi:hypothetical protein
MSERSTAVCDRSSGLRRLLGRARGHFEATITESKGAVIVARVGHRGEAACHPYLNAGLRLLAMYLLGTQTCPAGTDARSRRFRGGRWTCRPQRRTTCCSVLMKSLPALAAKRSGGRSLVDEHAVTERFLKAAHPVCLLAGVRVLDLRHVLARPFAAYQRALQGADVIKLEIPGAADRSRTWLCIDR